MRYPDGRCTIAVRSIGSLETASRPSRCRSNSYVPRPTSPCGPPARPPFWTRLKGAARRAATLHTCGSRIAHSAIQCSSWRPDAASAAGSTPRSRSSPSSGTCSRSANGPSASSRAGFWSPGWPDEPANHSTWARLRERGDPPGRTCWTACSASCCRKGSRPSGCARPSMSWRGTISADVETSG
jgi:hypothetical protein